MGRIDLKGEERMLWYLLLDRGVGYTQYQAWINQASEEGLSWWRVSRLRHALDSAMADDWEYR